MLDDNITLTLPNGGTPIDVDYRRFEEFQNRSIYVGDGHSFSLRDQVAFYRTLPRKSGLFLGVGKAAAKVTQDVSVLNANGEATIAPIIIETSVSIPVGASDADVNAAEDRVAALIADRDFINRLFQLLEI